MLLSHHSDKIGSLAEDVVLPRPERAMGRTSRTEDIEMQNVESPDPYTTTVTVDQPQKQPKHFPSFIIGISIVQVIYCCS